MVNFFWGFNKNNPRMHLTQAEWLFRPKGLGGLGCRRTALVNQALLAKHSWRFLSRPAALSSQWIHYKYLRPGTDLTFRSTSQDSPVWKGITQAASLVRDHIRWKIGNGRRVDITSPAWIAPWDGAPGWFQVSDIIDTDTGTWNWSRINDIYSVDAIDRIRFGPPPDLALMFLHELLLPLTPTLLQMGTVCSKRIRCQMRVTNCLSLVFLERTFGKSKSNPVCFSFSGILSIRLFLCSWFFVIITCLYKVDVFFVIMRMRRSIMSSYIVLLPELFGLGQILAFSLTVAGFLPYVLGFCSGLIGGALTNMLLRRFGCL